MVSALWKLKVSVSFLGDSKTSEMPAGARAQQVHMGLGKHGDYQVEKRQLGVVLLIIPQALSSSGISSQGYLVGAHTTPLGSLL